MNNIYLATSIPSLGELFSQPGFAIGFVAIFLFSLAFHESAHAWTADRYGDPTARSLGRVTLNPLKHLDIFWSFLMPLSLYIGTGGAFVFGGGKPVPVRVFQLRNFQLHNLYVSMAGPLSNFILATAFFILWWIYPLTGGTPDQWNYWLLFYACYLNYVLGVFNALPFPPLDGFAMIIYFLDRRTAEKWCLSKGLGMIPLIILMMSGLFGHILSFVMKPFFMLLNTTGLPGFG